MKQFNLRGILEFTACSGFLCAVGSAFDLITYGIAGAVLAIWSLRITRWPLRWMLFNWLAACSSILFGLAILQYAVLDSGAGYDASDFWLLCGCVLIAWTPLAGINGFLFLAESLSWANRGQNETRLRRNGVV